MATHRRFIVGTCALCAITSAHAGVVNFNTLAEQILLSKGFDLPEEEGDERAVTTMKSWFTGEVTVSSSENLYAAVEAVSFFGNTNIVRSFGVSSEGEPTTECVYIDSREWIAFDFVEPAMDISFTITGAQTGNAEEIPSHPITILAFDEDGTFSGVAYAYNEYSYGPGLHGNYELADYFGEDRRFSRIVIMSPTSEGANPFRGVRLGELEYTIAPPPPPPTFNLTPGARWSPWAKRAPRRR